MSTDTPPETGTPAPSSEPTAPTGAVRLPDDHPLVKAFNATKTELAQVRSKLREVEEADLTEVEKLRNQLTEEQKLRQTAQQQAMRLEVAIAKGLNATQAKRLVGDTIEELEADADELLASFKPQDAPVDRKPAENLRGGTDPTETPPVDVQSLIDSIPPTV